MWHHTGLCTANPQPHWSHVPPQGLNKSLAGIRGSRGLWGKTDSVRCRQEPQSLPTWPQGHGDVYWPLVVWAAQGGSGTGNRTSGICCNREGQAQGGAWQRTHSRAVTIHIWGHPWRSASCFQVFFLTVLGSFAQTELCAGDHLCLESQGFLESGLIHGQEVDGGSCRPCTSLRGKALRKLPHAGSSQNSCFGVTANSTKFCYSTPCTGLTWSPLKHEQEKSLWLKGAPVLIPLNSLSKGPAHHGPRPLLGPAQ